MATTHNGNGRFGVKRVNRMKFINRVNCTNNVKCLNRTKNYKCLMPDEINVGFDDVIGHYGAKKELEDILQFLETPEIYEQYGVIPYCKYMIIGHEGDGRSTLACAVAKTANVPIYVVEPSFFLDIDYVLDEMEQLFEEIYQLHVNGTKCMLLFKNIENFALVPDKDLNSILEKLVSFFRDMPELVAFSTVEGGTRIASLLFDPPAFNKQIQLDFTELKVREEILTYLLKEKKLPVDEDVDINRLAHDMYRMTFGNIKKVVKEVSLSLAKKKKKQKCLHYQDFAEVLAKLDFGYAKSKLSEKERLATARHEAGHVIAGYFAAPESYNVAKVDLTPRSSYAGVTQERLDEGRVGYFRDEMEAHIISDLGGMASEEFYYNQTSTGVSQDLLLATERAIGIFKWYGMSKTIGPISLLPIKLYAPEGEENGITNAILMAKLKKMEKLNEEADKLIQEFLKEMYEKTKKIINEHSAVLEELTQALMEKEVLYTDEIMAILKKNVVKSPKRAKSAKPNN